MNTVQIADAIGYIAAVIGIFTFLPQVIKCWQTKHTKDISLLTYSLLTIGAGLWTIYGLLLGAIPIILVNAVIGALSLFMVVLKLKYG